MYQMVSKKGIKFLVMIVIYLLVVFHLFGMASSITIQQLVTQPEQWDNKMVTLQGEVIGDVMKRGDHVWLNISDGSGAIGVWIGKEEAKDIQITGDYHYRGDRVEIEGVFHTAYTEQGGDMAIEGKALTVVEGGVQMLHAISFNKIVIVVILTLIVVGFNWVRILIWMKQKLKWKVKK